MEAQSGELEQGMVPVRNQRPNWVRRLSIIRNSLVWRVEVLMG